MTEREKILYVREFLSKMAYGINPIDDSEIPDGDLANNVKISRCFFHAVELLTRLVDSDEEFGAVDSRSDEGAVTVEAAEDVKEKLLADDEDVTQKTILEKINKHLKPGAKKVNHNALREWLIEHNILTVNEEGEKMPTDFARELGVYTRLWNHDGRDITIICYPKAAQQFIYDNIESLIETYMVVSVGGGRKGKKWTDLEDAEILRLDAEGVSLRNIAKKMGRTTKMVARRLRKLREAMKTGARVADDADDVDDGTLESSVKTSSTVHDAEIDEAERIAIEISREAERHSSPIRTVTYEAAPIKSTASTKSCSSCKFRRNGECFGANLCADYEEAFSVSSEEREAWPKYGSALSLRFGKEE